MSSLFAAPERRSDVIDKELLERAIERAVAGTDPRLHALSGYRKRLREPIECAVRHVIELTGQLPEPAEISRKACRNDPRLRAFFVSPDHLQEVLGQCQALTEYRRAQQPGPDEAIYGMLSMVRSEKNVLGMDLRGDLLQREVAQVAVEFSQHRVVGAAGSEAESRRMLMRRGFDHLLEKALGSIVATRGRKAELDQQYQLLKRKLDAMQSGRWGLDSVFAADDAQHTDVARLESEIVAIEGELLALGTHPNSLEYSLQQLSTTLGSPERWLDLRSVRLEIDQMSIKSGPGSTGRSYRLDLTELFATATGERRVVLLGRVPVSDLPPIPDFLTEAERLLG
jgi:hypothetical protein